MQLPVCVEAAHTKPLQSSTHGDMYLGLFRVSLMSLDCILIGGVSWSNVHLYFLEGNNNLMPPLPGRRVPEDDLEFSLLTLCHDLGNLRRIPFPTPFSGKDYWEVEFKERVQARSFDVSIQGVEKLALSILKFVASFSGSQAGALAPTSTKAPLSSTLRHVTRIV